MTTVGRKFPLLQIRQDLLSKHEKYMRLTTNAEIESMSYSDLSSMLSQYNYQVSTEETTELQRVAKAFQRTRSLILWHDHGSILALGCIILTVHITYDPAVFLTMKPSMVSLPPYNLLVEQPDGSWLICSGRSTCATPGSYRLLG